MPKDGYIFHHGNELFPKNIFLKVPSGDIFQIAEFSIIESCEIAGNIQQYDEIIYIISGKGTIYSDEARFDVSAKQIHFSTKGTYRKIVADKDSNLRCYAFGFIANNLSTEMKHYQENVRKVKYSLTKDDGNMNLLFQLLMNEYSLCEKWNSEMFHHYFCQIITTLCRIVLKEENSEAKKSLASTTDALVYRTKEYINQQARNIVSVKEIAADLSYSEYYLSHIFKQKMNVTLKTYLLQRKILESVELLKNTDLRIEEISECINFSSSHTFRQAFKKYMGMSASEYRKTYDPTTR